MEPEELADKLREMLKTAEELKTAEGKDEKSLQGLLFGIKYAEELKAAKQAGYSIATIRKMSIKENYDTDISKGMRLALAGYVKLKQ